MMRKARIFSIFLIVAILSVSLIPLVTPQPVMAYEEKIIYVEKDTYISRAVPTGNYYDSIMLWVSGYRETAGFTFETKAILEFDIDWGVDVPSDAGILSAVLRLYYKSSILDPSWETLLAHRMLRTDWYQTSATWNEYKWATPWTTPGGWGEGTDYTNTDWAFTGVPSSYGWVEIFITGQVQWAQTNNEDVFVILGSDSEWSGECGFYSRDYAGTTYDPHLVIHYVPAIVPIVPPTVTTSLAASLTETASTLRGNLVDDGGEACSVRFQYGTSTAYGVNTAWSPGYETGESFSKRVYGLVAGTVYHYRAQAVNGEGTVSSGSDRTFTTLPYKPYNFVATAGDTEVVLTWSKGDGAVNTMIRRSTTSYPTTPSSGTQVYFDTGTSETDDSLANGTTYYYSAWSFANDYYSSSYVTDSATPSAPAVPDCTTNAATNVGVATARLNMHLDALHGAASATVSLEYYKEGSAPWGSETDTSVYYDTGLYYADVVGLDAVSTYYCRAKAVSTAGTGYGATVSFVTGANSAPTMTTQSATGVMRLSATLNGKVTADGGVSVTGWFEWGLVETNLDHSTASISGLVTDDTFYYGLTDLESNTQYYYRAIGENSVGIGYGEIVNFTTSTASAPTVRTDGAAPGANQAVLNGMVLTDGGVLCEVRFQYGLTVAYGTDTAWLPDYGAGESFNQLVAGLEVDTTYHYRAQANNEGGTSSGSDETFTTMFTAPTDFRAKTISHTSISLEWDQTGDMALIRYQKGTYPIDRDDGSQAYFGTGTAASVSGLESGTTYYFRAWAWREGNVWSDSYTSDVATTFSFVDPSDEPPVEVTPPGTPDRWFQIPSGAALRNMPLYDQIAALANSLAIPEGSWWFGVAVGLMLLVGGLLWRFTRRAALALIAAGFTVVVCVFLGMMPLWFLLVYAAFAGGITFVSQRI